MNLQAKFASFFGPGITAEVGELNALPNLSFSFSFFFGNYTIFLKIFLKLLQGKERMICMKSGLLLTLFPVLHRDKVYGVIKFCYI